jgi:hypothetical protein
MSAEPAPLRRLAPVDLDTGEVVHPEIARLQEEIHYLKQALEGANADLVTKRAQITRLKKDKAEERTKYHRRADVVRIHKYWQRRLGNKQGLTADRFDAIKGQLEETELRIVEGKAEKVPVWEFPEDFKKAIDGAWFDPHTKPMRNGRIQKFNDLELIFRDGSHMRSFTERAPDWGEQAP